MEWDCHKKTRKHDHSTVGQDVKTGVEILDPRIFGHIAYRLHIVPEKISKGH